MIEKLEKSLLYSLCLVFKRIKQAKTHFKTHCAISQHCLLLPFNSQPHLLLLKLLVLKLVIIYFHLFFKES